MLTNQLFILNPPLKKDISNISFESLVKILGLLKPNIIERFVTVGTCAGGSHRQWCGLLTGGVEGFEPSAAYHAQLQVRTGHHRTAHKKTGRYKFCDFVGVNLIFLSRSHFISSAR